MDAILNALNKRVLLVAYLFIYILCNVRNCDDVFNAILACRFVTL